MAPSQDAGVLHQQGRYAEALHSLRATGSARTLIPNEEVLLSELLAVTGELGTAIALAERLLAQRDLTVQQSCRIRETLGHCYFRNGNTEQGTEQYRAGIEIAERSSEFVAECQLRVHLFRDLVRWVGPQPAVADLSMLRRKIHHVAEPTIAITFHLSLAELAAKLALLPRARKHLETARALLSQVSNHEIQLSFRRSEVALATEEGDFVEALRAARKLIREEGPEPFGINVTLGHLLIVQGKFDEADKWLQNRLAFPNLSGGKSIALRDTLMQLKLDQNLLEEAAALSGVIDKQLILTREADSFFGLWYLATKTKWLFRSEQVQHGLAVATEAIPRVRQMADRNLLHRMTLLVAEGEALRGDAVKAASIIGDLFRDNEDPSPSLIAETLRVAGKAASVDCPNEARSYFDSSARILGIVGNLASKADVERELLQGLPIKKEVDSALTARLTERIAWLIELGAHPDLLADQIFSLIVDADAAESVRLSCVNTDDQLTTISEYRQGGSNKPVESHPSAITLHLGSHRKTRYEVTIIPKTKSSARITILAVERLLRSAIRLAQSKQQEREQAALWPEQTPERQLGLICSSERMLELVKTIRRVATSNLSVLLTGETGVGKELFARALHQASSRSEKVFLPFNCTAVPREVFDSQLFGHRRGSFTGATDDSIGVIRSAAGGTLFLDEIGEMSLDTQPKLLRFLESGEIRALGESRPQLVDVRIVAATNAKLEQLVAEGRFREDLYYRLNVIRINIPPLRERREEIPALVEHFLERFGRELQKAQLRIADETLEYLVLYRWPGNVRQLANEIRRMVALAEPGAVLMPAHLSEDIAASRKTIPAERPALQSTEVLTRLDQPLTAAVEHIERAAIQRAVALAEGNLIEAAKLLGLSRKGLYLKRQRLGLA